MVGPEGMLYELATWC